MSEKPLIKNPTGFTGLPADPVGIDNQDDSKKDESNDKGEQE